MTVSTEPPRARPTRSTLVAVSTFVVALIVFVAVAITADVDGQQRYENALGSRAEALGLYELAQDAHTDAEAKVAAGVADASSLASMFSAASATLAPYADATALAAATSASAALTASVDAVASTGATVTSVSSGSTGTAGIAADTVALQTARTSLEQQNSEALDAVTTLGAQATTLRVAIADTAVSVLSRGQAALDASPRASAESRDALSAALAASTSAAAASRAGTPADLTPALVTLVSAIGAVEADQAAAQAEADAENAAAAAAAAARAANSGSSSSGSGGSGSSSGGSGGSGGGITFPEVPTPVFNPPLSPLPSVGCSDPVTGVPIPCS